ncbi:MAG TPA: pyridoxamine 5'-phosphate oxidase family protein [Chitinophagaceae bacterium]|nr:pyridoxamine 5'-phosphate oxidase family protein [Chitinophagaceae bacterium]
MEQLLSKQLVGRLGCHANGTTYVVPISYAYKDGYIYCHTMEGLKISILRKEPRVCFQVDNTKDLSNWQSVICWGEFEELKGHAEKRDALSILNARQFPMVPTEKMQINTEWPFVDSNTDDIQGIFFRIRIDDKTGRYEDSGSSGSLTN